MATPEGRGQRGKNEVFSGDGGNLRGLSSPASPNKILVTARSAAEFE